MTSDASDEGHLTVLRQLGRLQLTTASPQLSCDSFHWNPIQERLTKTRLRSPDPVRDRDMNLGITRPLLARHSIGDDAARLDDVIQRSTAVLVLPQRVRRDQTSALAVLEVFGRPAEPVGGVVHDSDTEFLLEPVDVLATHRSANPSVAEEGWIADDAVRLGPLDTQRIGGADALQINEWQHVLGVAVLVAHLLVAHPQRDARDHHRDPFDVEPEQVRQRVVRPRSGRRRYYLARCERTDPALELSLQPAQLPVRDVEVMRSSA